jgi:hypothetical protein
MEEDKVILVASMLLKIINRQVKPEVFQWLEEKGRLIQDENNPATLKIAFAAAPRKTGRAVIEVTDSELAVIETVYNGFTIKNWTIDKLSRLWLVLQVSSNNENLYHSCVESLFRDAEMNELTVLYAFLPVFAFSESWQFRTTEGIRSNIGTVLESIMYENSYPYKYLSESSWNQLVLKAFFTEKDVNRIRGLHERSNEALAAILVDYAHERQAAHRMVNPQLWRLVSKFINEKNVTDIEKLFEDAHVTVRRAAVLACFYSNYEPARQLMKKEPGILQEVALNRLSWNTL